MSKNKRTRRRQRQTPDRSGSVFIIERGAFGPARSFPSLTIGGRRRQCVRRLTGKPATGSMAASNGTMKEGSTASSTKISTR